MGPAAAGTRAKVNTCITKVDANEGYIHSLLNEQARDKGQEECGKFVRIQ